MQPDLAELVLDMPDSKEVAKEHIYLLLESRSNQEG
jgi:hypothetical protein